MRGLPHPYKLLHACPLVKKQAWGFLRPHNNLLRSLVANLPYFGAIFQAKFPQNQDESYFNDRKPHFWSILSHLLVLIGWDLCCSRVSASNMNYSNSGVVHSSHLLLFSALAGIGGHNYYGHPKPNCVQEEDTCSISTHPVAPTLATYMLMNIVPFFLLSDLCTFSRKWQLCHLWVSHEPITWRSQDCMVSWRLRQPR